MSYALLICAAVAAASLLYLPGCGGAGTDDQGDGVDMPKRPIEEVIREHTGELMSIPGVVGTGQGDCGGEPCIIVLVVEMGADILDKVPHRIEGYGVRVQATGEIRPLEE